MAAQTGPHTKTLAPAATPADGEAATRPCRTNLIPDEASAKDEFGTHARVADAVAGLITSGAEGVSVGIEGGWGSGKTTVLNLLKARLKDNPDYAVIQFDAWAHEGDPLRLIFLQNAFRHLRQNGWLGREKAAEWERRLEEVANRRETKVTKEYPQLSGLGKAFGLALLLVPLSAAFVGAALRDDRLTLFTGVISWRFVVLFGVGLLLAAAPVIVILVRWLSMPAAERAKEESLWTLLFNKGVEENRTETIKSANPTSIDFEETFVGMMGDVLADTKRRAVIVLDNLDRVDSKDALAIWSTLQTFLNRRSGGKGDWAARLWIVALYDPTGLSLIWEKSAPASGAGPSAQAAPVAQSFMDKSFQVRFEVSAPVLSDWRDFLVKRLREAFPDHARPGGAAAEEDFHAVYRVLAIHFNRCPFVPTIRELKLFVNQIGALHRQWTRPPDGEPREADTFPLPHIAYYVLLRRQRRDVARGLVAAEPSEKLPEPEYVHLLGEGLADSLAALNFNVEVGRARQLLIGPELKGALARGLPEPNEPAQPDAAESLKALAAAYTEGFWAVLEDAVRREWAEGEAPMVAYAAYNLERSGLLDNSPRPEVGHITDTLCDWAGKVEKWSPLDDANARGLAAILRWKRLREKRTDRAREYILKVLRAVAAGLEGATDIKKWGELTALLQKELDVEGFADTFDKGLIDPLAVELDWPLPSQRPVDYLASVLEVLTELRGQSTGAARRLREMAKHGRLLPRVPRLPGSGEASFTAWLIFTYFREVFDASLPDNSAAHVAEGRKGLIEMLRDPGAFLPGHFAGLIRRYKEFPLLFGIYERDPETAGFVGACLRLILQEEDAEEVLPAAALVKHWVTISALTNEDETSALMDKHIAQLSGGDAPLEAYLKSNGFERKLMTLYRRVLEATSPDPLRRSLAARDFAAWFSDYLRTVSKKQWEDEMLAGSDILMAAHAAQRLAFHLELGEPFLAALTEHAEGLAHGKGGMYAHRDSEAPRLLRPDLREAFRYNLYEIACRLGGKVEALFFDTYGKELLNSSALAASGTSFEDIFIPLLRNPNVRVLIWLTEVFRTHPSLIDSRRQLRSVEEFRRLLGEARRDAKDSVAGTVAELADLFKVGGGTSPVGPE